MFSIQKARSRKNNVEYLELDVKKIHEFLMEQEAPVIQVISKFEYHSHNFPLRSKSSITLIKKMTKGKKIVKEILIQFNHNTWESGVRFDENLNYIGGYNYNQFEVSYGWDKSDKNLLYLVMDGGFDYSQNRHPYFLHDYEFNYVFERMD